MTEKINGVIPAEEWLNVGFQVSRPNDPLDGLMDDIRTDNLIAKWQSIASEYNVPVMAYFHAFDTEAHKALRIPVDTHNVRKGLIKVKLNQSELVRQYLEHGVRDEQLRDYVLNDGIRLADQVFTRSKVAKAELLATGKITIEENGLNLTVEYGVPEAHTSFTLDFSPSADISGQIQNIVDQAAGEGVTINGMLTSRNNIRKLARNTGLQSETGGTEGAVIPRDRLSAFFDQEFGISRLIADDLCYGEKATVGADGRPAVSKKRYYPEDRVTFFAANPAGLVGSGLWGDPPEAELGGFYPVSASGEAPFVYVTQKMEWDPAILWTKASGLFMPVLYDPNSLWIAKVNP